MELPVSPQSYQPDSASLVRGIVASMLTLAETCANPETLAGGVMVARPDRPGVRAVNFTASFEPSPDASPREQVDLLLNAYTSQAARCHAIYPAGDRLPAAMEETLRQSGYQPARRIVFAMDGFRRPARLNPRVQVVPARAIYGQLDAFYQQMARVEHHADDRLAADYARTMIDFLDDTRLEIYIARLEGQNLACAGVMSLGQMGVIVPAWSDPTRRGQGLAAAVMTHVMDLCARALFQQVILDRAEHCPAIGFYESLGFHAKASFVKYRRVGTGSASHG